MATGPSFGPAEALAITYRGIPTANSLACRFYVWLLDRPLFRHVGISTLAGFVLGTVCRFALMDLLYFGWLYAESNTDIQMAARIARVIKLVPVRRLGGEYFDTLAWIAYRSGDASEGLRWAHRISENDTHESAIRAYHLYFLLRGLNADLGTQDLIRDSFRSQTYESVEQARVLANGDTTAGSVDITRKQPPSLPFRTRSALIVLLLGIAFVLYRPAFVVFLWFIGGLLAFGVLCILGTFVYVGYGWFSQRIQVARQK